MERLVEALKALFGTEELSEVLTKKMTKDTKERVAPSALVRVEMSADECKKACDKIKLEYLSGYESRVLQYTMTDETVDRYGDIVKAKGLDLKRYMTNPVVMTFHDYNQFPVGQVLKAWYDKPTESVKAQVLFLDNRVDVSGLADAAFRFAASGAMKGCSIGFLPTGIKTPTDAEREKLGMPKFGVIYESSELLELTVCPIPANPGAMKDSIKRGMYRPDAAAGYRGAIPDDAWAAAMKAVEDIKIEPETPPASPDPIVPDAPVAEPPVPESGVAEVKQMVETLVKSVSEIVNSLSEIRAKVDSLTADVQGLSLSSANLPKEKGAVDLYDAVFSAHKEITKQLESIR